MTAGEKLPADGLTAHTGNKGVNVFADIYRGRLVI